MPPRVNVQTLGGKIDTQRRDVARSGPPPARSRSRPYGLVKIAGGTQMADPLLKTFELLAESKAPAAVDLLIAALESKYGPIHERAIVALLRRGTTR